MRIGRFEAAAGGTLFLDEIGNLSPSGQAKLLRVLHFLATLPGPDGVAASRLATLGEPAREALLQHEWPGNVRELQNRIHRATLVCGGDVILPEHLGLGAASVPLHPPTRTAFGGPAVVRSAAATDPAARPPGSSAGSADLDRAVVEDALLRAGGIVSKAAADMGVSRQTLYRRMERAGVVLERRPKM